jgi:hypothetical protein
VTKELGSNELPISILSMVTLASINSLYGIGASVSFIDNVPVGPVVVSFEQLVAAIPNSTTIINLIFFIFNNFLNILISES